MNTLTHEVPLIQDVLPDEKEALRAHYQVTHPVGVQDHATLGYEPVAPETYGKSTAEIMAAIIDHEIGEELSNLSRAELEKAGSLILSTFEGRDDEDKNGRETAPDSMFVGADGLWQTRSSGSDKYARSLRSIETTAAQGTIAELAADVQFDLDFPQEEPLFEGYELPLGVQLTNALRLARPNVQNIYSGAQENEPRVDFLDGYIIR